MRLMLSAVALIGLSAAAAPVPAVVELFTSQGCSSCPPADRLLGELAGRGDVIALAYHVDYWDQLGWRDRFGLAAASERQRAYARRLGLAGIYTPQAVVDGGRDMVGSDRAALLASLAGRHDGIAPVLAVGDGRLTADLPAAPRGGSVTLVFTAAEAETKVARGENAGRSLREFAVVRAVRDLGAWDGAARRFTVALAGLPDDCSDAALLIQDGAAGAVIGAAAVPLGRR